MYFSWNDSSKSGKSVPSKPASICDAIEENFVALTKIMASYWLKKNLSSDWNIDDESDFDEASYRGIMKLLFLMEIFSAKQ